ncbi:hypothetical protein PCANC_14831 [Puccinia coronata f. sp. avenae]|uniref:Uncharacterized protein n=1 Tax=Puccinia coronata f. sp. avenae TaxID=200324 RepID=A0A2N5UIB5_9BASI|nr:hypothetical protein PCANC_14831 [Puccinia coronata f. sp. avenae]
MNALKIMSQWCTGGTLSTISQRTRSLIILCLQIISLKTWERHRMLKLNLFTFKILHFPLKPQIYFQSNLYPLLQ